MKKLRKLYSLAVNVCQFHAYGRSWAQIPYWLVTTMGSIGVLIMLFNLPDSPSLLFFFALMATIGVVGVGAVLFKSRAQQIDRIMDSWRSPIGNLLLLTMDVGQVELYKKLGLPFPNQFKEWGMTDWDDIYKMVDYVLKIGENAQAQSICRKFFSTEKKFGKNEVT